MMKKLGFLFLVMLLFSACKPKEEKFFSVIIPTYNRETFLPKAIDSVLSQDYNNYEIIVIDDGSTDNTVKLMNDYLAKDKRIKFLINDENKGVSYSRNRGINEAKGEFVTFLDSDDIFLEGFFNEMNKAIHDNPDAVFFTTWGKMFNGTKEIGNFETSSFLEYLYLNTTTTSGTTIKKSFLLNNNLKFDESWRTAEDYKLWTDIFILDVKMVIIKKLLISIERGERGFFPADYSLSMKYRSIKIRKKVREHLSKEKKDYCSIFKSLIKNKDERFSLSELKRMEDMACYVENEALKKECEKTSKCFVLYHPHITRPMMLYADGSFCSKGNPSCGKIEARTKDKIEFIWQDGFKETFYKLDYFPNSYYAD